MSVLTAATPTKTGVDFAGAGINYEAIRLAADIPLVNVLKSIIWKFNSGFASSTFITTRFLLEAQLGFDIAEKILSPLHDKYDNGYIGKHDLIMIYDIVDEDNNSYTLCTEEVSISGLDYIVNYAINIDIKEEYRESTKRNWERTLDSLKYVYQASYYERLNFGEFFKVRKRKSRYNKKMAEKRQLIFNNIFERCSSTITVCSGDDIVTGFKYFDDILIVPNDSTSYYNELMVFILDDGHNTINYICAVDKDSESTPILHMTDKGNIVNDPTVKNEFMISGISIPITDTTSIVEIISTITRWVSNIDIT